MASEQEGSTKVWVLSGRGGVNKCMDSEREERGQHKYVKKSIDYD